jgi:hypothetical protein
MGRPGTERSVRRPVRQPQEAVKYALFENGHHPETIVELCCEIELDMGDYPSSDHVTAASTLSRRVA